MSLVFLVLAGTLGIVFLWGLLAPRSQWRVLNAWSVSDPRASEPGSISYGLRQFFYALGLGSMVFLAIGTGVNYLANLPKPPTPLTPMQLMWGTPAPTVVNRYVLGQTSVPAGLVDQPILGYQAWAPDHTPDYLDTLAPFTRVGTPVINGYIGEDPQPDLVGTDTADLVVHVRGDLLCVPRAAVVIETDTTVQIAIEYGLPIPTDGSQADNVAACSPNPAVSTSLLIPIDLSKPVGKRSVQALDGTEIDLVRVVE
ncbi:MAG: fumarate hydratase [Rhodoglobus sp.]